ncbi:MAG: tetratricopeptide repeat protein [Candidatus Devosia euplotis]|nr:tetratricopeptide repeat protein [Candidatus Devosia euplotis]
MSHTEHLRAAAAVLDRAIGLSPVSAFIWEQHARLQQETGQFDNARTAYGSTIQLNPANADALAGYARLLAFGGNVAAAETMARDAAEGTPNPPDWYFGVPALLELRSGVHGQAIEYAVRYSQADHELEPILAILAGQRGGDGAIVNRYLVQVLDVASFRGGWRVAAPARTRSG